MPHTKRIKSHDLHHIAACELYGRVLVRYWLCNWTTMIKSPSVVGATSALTHHIAVHNLN